VPHESTLSPDAGFKVGLWEQNSYSPTSS